jgi:hypothetical protein
MADWVKASLLRSARRLARQYLVLGGPVEPITYEAVISNYSGPKRRRYENAYDQLMEYGLEDRDYVYTGFVKFEQLDSAKVNKVPRIIQFPSFKLILYMMRYIKPIEARFRHIHDFTGTTIFAKGLNLKERAETMHTKWQSFGDPVSLRVDCKHYDVGVTADALYVRAKFYRHLIDDEEFHAVVDKQVQTKLVFRDNLRFASIKATYEANVKSGSANTGEANSNGQAISIMAGMEHAGFADGEYAFLVDGDDAHIYVEKHRSTDLDLRLGSFFHETGHKLTIEGWAHDIHEIQFCQSNVVYVAGAPIMVRDPCKVLSNSLCTNKFKSPNAMRRFVRAVGECELALNAGVPILQEYALALLRNTEGVKPLPPWEIEAFQHRVWTLHHNGPQVIADSTRVSFEKAFGFSAQEQVAIESRLRKWIIGFDVPRQAPDDLSPLHWSVDYSMDTLVL